MNSTALCHALLSGDHHSQIERNRYRLEWAANRLALAANPGEPCGRLLGWIVEYDKQYGYCPDSKAVKDFVELLKSSGKDSINVDECNSQLEIAEKYVHDQGSDIPTTVPPLIDATVDMSWRLFHAHTLDLARKQALGELSVGKNGDKRKATPVDAMSYLREVWATKDLREFAPRPAGVLQDNTAFLDAEIDRMVSGVSGSERIWLGLTHVDNQLVISKKLRPFIGIMGFANDGKTTVLLTMLYNMAMDGKSVILFTKEHDPVEMWMHFAFLHSHQYRKEFILPSQTDFEKGNIKDTDRENIKRIIKDIRENKGIPGRIEVQVLTDWESVVTHLSTHHKTAKYDVCALDYLTRIDIPGVELRWREKVLSAYINAAQGLTRSFDGGKGIVVITPIQINRSGYQAAKKRKEGEKKHDLTSVSQYSEFYQDMDFIISIYSDDEMKSRGEMLIETQKVRGAAFPPSAIYRVDVCSRYVTRPNDAVIDKKAQDWMDGRTSSPVTKWLRDEVIGSLSPDILDSITEVGEK